MGDADIQRQLKLMGVLGIWSSHVSGPWIENGSVCVLTDQSFPTPRRIDVKCRHREVVWHPFIPDTACLIGQLSVKPTKPKRRAEAVNALLTQITEGIVWPWPANPVTSMTKTWPDDLDLDPTLRRFDIADGRWFTVQERFYRGAVEIAHPDTWKAIHLPEPSTTTCTPRDYPLIVGSTGGQITALIMPLARPCDADWRPRADVATVGAAS